MWRRAVWVVGPILLCLLASVYPYEDDCPPLLQGNGTDKLLVYSSDTVFNKSDPHPQFPCHGDEQVAECDGIGFYKSVLGFTDKQVAREEQKAKDFFKRRFGIDVDDPELSGRIAYSSFFLDPRRNVRARVLSGECPPPAEGWKGEAGGFLAAVVDPEGFVLGGEKNGTRVPRGVYFAFGLGAFNISNGRNPRREIYRTMSSSAITLLHGFGENVKARGYEYDVVHPLWGKGKSQGIARMEDLGNGLEHSVFTGVITFSGMG